MASDPTTPPRPNHTQIPNLYDDSSLSVYAFRLLVHIRRVAGDSGSCWEGTRTMATICNMSVGQMSKAKLELVDVGYITIGRKAVRGGFADEMRIVDVWDLNTKAYEKSVHHTNTNSTVQDTNTNEDTVHTVNASDVSVHHTNTKQYETIISVHETEVSVHTVNESRFIDQDIKSAAKAAPKKRALKSPVETQAHLLDTPLSIYRQVTNNRNPNQAQRDLMETVTELTLWRATCEEFAVRGWKVRDLVNMIDNYNKRVDVQKRVDAQKARYQQPASYTNGHAAPDELSQEEQRRRSAEAARALPLPVYIPGGAK